MKTISYAITACNEHVELEYLLSQLKENIHPEDQVVVQLDANATEEVIKVVEKYNISKVYATLNGDFATFKNNLKLHCTKDYIFFIDADEYLSEWLLQLPEVIELNPEIDMFAVPRINTVEGLTPEHIKQWGWRVDERGWINYPDYQTRICKNREDIRWVGKVHERLSTYQPCVVQTLPDGFELLHPKDIARQEKQNNFYNTL